MDATEPSISSVTGAESSLLKIRELRDRLSHMKAEAAEALSPDYRTPVVHRVDRTTSMDLPTDLAFADVAPVEADMPPSNADNPSSLFDLTAKKITKYAPGLTIAKKFDKTDLENYAPIDAPSSYSFRHPPLPSRAVSVAQALQPHNYPAAANDTSTSPKSVAMTLHGSVAWPHVALESNPPTNPTTMVRTMTVAEGSSGSAAAGSPTRPVDSTHERLMGLRRTQELLQRQSDTLNEMLANLESNDMHTDIDRSSKRRPSMLLMTPKEMAFKRLEALRIELVHQDTSTLDTSLPQPGFQGSYPVPQLALVAESSKHGEGASASASRIPGENVGEALEAEGLEAEGLLKEGIDVAGASSALEHGTVGENGKGMEGEDEEDSSDEEIMPSRFQESLPSQGHLLKLLRSRHHNQEQVLSQRLAATRIIKRWRKWLGRRSASHARTVRARRTYGMRLLRKSFVVLTEYTKLSAELHRMEKKAAAHHRMVTTVPLLRIWHVFAKRKHDSKRRLVAACAQHRGYVSRLALNRWSVLCDESKRRRAAVELADRSWNARLAQFAIFEWEWFVDTEHAAKASLAQNCHYFRRWRRSAVRTREEEASMQRAIKQCKFASSRYGIRGLAAEVAFCKMVRKALTWRRRVFQQRMFRIWTRYWQGRGARQAMFETADVFFEATATRSALQFLGTYRQHQVGVRRARAHFESGLLRWATQIWREEARQSKRESSMGTWYMEGLQERCFRALVTYVEARVAKAAQELVAYELWVRVSQRRCLVVFSAYTEARRQRRRAVEHYASVVLHRSFAQWVEHHREERCDMMAASFFDGVLQRCFFERWLHYFDSRCEKRALVERADLHWMRVARSRAIGLILDHLDATKDLRRAVRKFDALLMMRTFHSFCAGVLTSKNEKRAYGLHSKLVSKRMLSGWRGYISLRRGKKALKARADAHIAQKRLRVGVKCLHHGLELELKRARMARSFYLHRILQAHVGRVFRGVREYSRRRLSKHRLKEQGAAHHRRHVSKRAVALLRHHALFERELRSDSKKSQKFFVEQLLARCYGAWRDHSVARREKRLLFAALTETELRRIVLVRWHRRVSKRIHERAAVARAADHHTTKLLREAVHGWQVKGRRVAQRGGEGAAEQHHAASRSRWALVRMHTATRRRLHARATASAAERFHAVAMVRAAMLVWRDAAALHEHGVSSLVAASAHHASRLKRAALWTWRGKAEDQSQGRHRLEVGAYFHTTRRMHETVQRWHATMDHLRMQRAMNAELLEIGKQFHHQRRLQGALWKWHHLITPEGLSGKRLRATAATAHDRRRAHHSMATMFEWTKKQIALREMRARQKERQRCDAVHTWFEWGRRRVAIRDMEARRESRRRRDAIHVWFEWASQRAARRATLTDADAWADFHATQRGVHELRSHMEDSRSSKALAELADYHAEAAFKRAGLGAFRDRCERAHSVARAESWCETRSVRVATRDWRATVVDIQAAREMRERAEAWANAGLMEKCLKAWVSFLAYAKRERAKEAAADRLNEQRVLNSAFVTWLTEAAHGAMVRDALETRLQRLSLEVVRAWRAWCSARKWKLETRAIGDEFHNTTRLAAALHAFAVRADERRREAQATAHWGRRTVAQVWAAWTRMYAQAHHMYMAVVPPDRVVDVPTSMPRRHKLGLKDLATAKVALLVLNHSAATSWIDKRKEELAQRHAAHLYQRKVWRYWVLAWREGLCGDYHQPADRRRTGHAAHRAHEGQRDEPLTTVKPNPQPTSPVAQSATSSFVRVFGKKVEDDEREYSTTGGGGGTGGEEDTEAGSSEEVDSDGDMESMFISGPA